MFTKNKVLLTGYVGNDPKIVVFENGGKNASFSLATKNNYTNQAGDKIEETDWHNIVVKGNSAIIVEKYIKAGTYVSVEGVLRYRSYEDKNNIKVNVTEIIATDILFFNSKD